jgi:hypothetical protein
VSDTKAKVYATKPDGPTYRWECDDPQEPCWAGDTEVGRGLLTKVRRSARQHTTETGHTTILWRLISGYERYEYDN